MENTYSKNISVIPGKFNIYRSCIKSSRDVLKYITPKQRDKKNLNYLLMMAPMWVIDAVIAHELAHITHKNHSKDFYQLLDSMISTRK
jgi:predicted metal-dependent hydrolase